MTGGAGSSKRLADLADRVQSSGGRLRGAARKLPDEIDEAEVLKLAPSLLEDLRSWAERLDVNAFPA